MKSPFAQSELVQPATRRSRNYRIFSEKLSWGALPDGFNRVVDERGHRLVVRQDQVAHIDFSLCDNDRAGALADSRYHGRGVLRSIVLPDGDTALIRAYRHGGFFRTIATTWFFTWPPRPFRELVLTEELRRRGLRTVEVYAACVSRPAGPFYRGWLITKTIARRGRSLVGVSQRIDRTDWFNRGTARRSGWHPRDAPGRGLPRRS